MVCRDTCWEPRNAQDFVRGVPDKQAPPWVRPEPADTFVQAEYYRREDGTVLFRESGVPLYREA